MSAGNLHPVEVYVVRSGVHHYQPIQHALVALRRPEEVPDPGPGAASVLSGIPFRTCWKYGERGWRHLWWDAGTIVANLFAAAAAHGLAARVQAGFADDAVARLVGIDGGDELPLAVVQLGEADRVMPPGRLARSARHRFAASGAPGAALPIGRRGPRRRCAHLVRWSETGCSAHGQLDLLTESLLRPRNRQGDCDEPKFQALPDESWG